MTGTRELLELRPDTELQSCGRKHALVMGVLRALTTTMSSEAAPRRSYAAESPAEQLFFCAGESSEDSTYWCVRGASMAS